MQLGERSDMAHQRPRRTAEEMLELRREFEQTELTVHGFSKQYNISTGILYRWKRQGQSKEKEISGFAKVNINPGLSCANQLFAEVRGIKIYQAVSASYLKELEG